MNLCGDSSLAIPVRRRTGLLGLIFRVCDCSSSTFKYLLATFHNSYTLSLNAHVGNVFKHVVCCDLKFSGADIKIKVLCDLPCREKTLIMYAIKRH
ncbi:unnamed protein product [Larinioides sclopetarius]|uniref:Uncharacterized protein n=1 Tax=Larinioides sclopetarius TaxID=280406 RepID=A0AAV1ZNH0_9ARAC